MNIRMGKSKSRTRDLGLDAGNGPGKGDRDRTTNLKAYAQGYTLIFPWFPARGKFHKTYK